MCKWYCWTKGKISTILNPIPSLSYTQRRNANDKKENKALKRNCKESRICHRRLRLHWIALSTKSKTRNGVKNKKKIQNQSECIHSQHLKCPPPQHGKLYSGHKAMSILSTIHSDGVRVKLGDDWRKPKLIPAVHGWTMTQGWHHRTRPNS